MRQAGQYVDPGGNAYGSSQMQRMPGQIIEHKSNSYQGQGGDASRSYYQSQGGQRLVLENQGSDLRSHPREEDMEVGYDDNVTGLPFEDLEPRFYDDILKLSKEHHDAEDAENARHRERLNAINAQYEEQLAALRTRHASLRDEFLRRESHARQQHYQYQQASAMEHQQYVNNPVVGFSDPHGYSRFPGGGNNNRCSRDPGLEPRAQYHLYCAGSESWDY